MNAQEVFKKNLKYISQTEISPELIKGQFVKSRTRFFLKVGEIDCPSGKIVVSDPLAYLAAGRFCPQMELTVPSGTYTAEVSICRNPLFGIRVCTAMLRIKETEAVKYVCAAPTEKTAVGKCADGILTGFPVDAGMISFCDSDVALEYQQFLNKWYEEHSNGNHYDDYFAEFFAESWERLPAYQREGGDFIEWTNPDSGKRLVMIASGFGDGFYQAFWGYDKNDDICQLIVPMVNPDLVEEC